MTPERGLVDVVASVRPSDVPHSTRRAIARTLIDTCAVGVAGSMTPGAAAVRAGVGSDGCGAGCWASAARIQPGTAALINGYQVHCLEFDCVHEAAVVHALSTPTASILAWAEHLGDVSGERLMTAVALGVDVAARLGLAAEGGLAFFRPATAGAFGAAVGCGWLSGLDSTRLLDVLGVVYGQTSGTMQSHQEGTPMLPLQIGFAARSAINAVEMVLAGVTGPHEVLFGKFGYFELFESGGSRDRLLDGLGRRWLVDEIAHKPYPTGRATHGAIQLCADFVRRTGAGAGDIDAVEISAPALVVQLAGRSAHDQMDPPWARLCIPYLVAHTLIRGGVDVGSSFEPEALRDGTTLALADRVTVVANESSHPQALVPLVMRVRLADGTCDESEATHLLGSPAMPLPDHDLDTKVRSCLESGGWNPAAVDALIVEIKRLPTSPTVDTFLDLLQNGAQR